MSLLVLSFVAGILTVLAPCTLPLLPIILGGSLNGSEKKWKPFVITASLAVSLIVFTLVLKVSTVFINVSPKIWPFISGTVILFLGVISLFPDIWQKISTRFQFSKKSEERLSISAQKKSYWGDVLIGASLGPVFSSCSPTYFLILATVLPQSFGVGFVYLVAYAFGLSFILLLVAFIGQKFVRKIAWAANPKGWFKRILGILFVLMGLLIMTGYDKVIQTRLVENGYFDITKVEQLLLKDTVK